jgi:hypothetical protein
MKKKILIGLIILFLLVCGCGAALWGLVDIHAEKEWTEIFGTQYGALSISKISIREDNVTCYVNGNQGGIYCFDELR